MFTFRFNCVRSPLAVISIPFGRRSPPSTTTIKQRCTNFRSCLLRKAFDSGELYLLVSPHIYVESLWLYRDQARSVSPEQHEEALKSLYIYKRWLLDTYLQSGRSNPVLVLPLGEVRPNHRDEWPRCVSQTIITYLTLTKTHSDDIASDQQLWEPLLIAPIIGAPELVVPGASEYISFLDAVATVANTSSRTNFLRIPRKWTAGAIARLCLLNGATR